MKISLWYAVNGSRQAMVFTSKPERDNKRKIWVGNISSATIRFMDWLEVDCGFELPSMTWKDECREITVEADFVSEDG